MLTQWFKAKYQSLAWINGPWKWVHNEFSLGIPHLNQFNHLTYKMRQRNMSFYELLYMQEGNAGAGAVVKWVDYGAAGQSQEWDLLTHLMSTSSGAACWMWPHPLLRNPTRDDLASTQATLLDLTRAQLSATRGPNTTLMWLHSMTERIMWRRCLRTWEIRGRGGGEQGVQWAVCRLWHSLWLNSAGNLQILKEKSQRISVSINS